MFQSLFVPQQIFLKDMDKVVNQKKNPNPTTKYGPRKVQSQALEQGISWSWVVLMAMKLSVQQLRASSHFPEGGPFIQGLRFSHLGKVNWF